MRYALSVTRWALCVKRYALSVRLKEAIYKFMAIE